MRNHHPDVTEQGARVIAEPVILTGLLPGADGVLRLLAVTVAAFTGAAAEDFTVPDITLPAR